MQDGTGLVGVSLLPYDEDSVDPPSFRFVGGSAAPGGGVAPNPLDTQNPKPYTLNKPLRPGF